jgi:RNA polymerase sigma factor (sigma-70 family)
MAGMGKMVERMATDAYVVPDTDDFRLPPYMQAWITHRLSRAEEEAHTALIQAEIARLGTDVRYWSREACISRDALMLGNLWVVVRAARQYPDRGIELEDLVQFGVIGLIRAVEKFDRTKGFRFSTYAEWWAWQAVIRGITNYSRMIRLPVDIVDAIKRIAPVAHRIEKEKGRPPTADEIALATEIEGADVRKMLSISQEPVSLDAPLAKDDANVGDYISDTLGLTLDEEAASGPILEAVTKAFGSLSERERQVLVLRYGLDDGNSRTLEAVGKVFGVTRERIRQIEAKALRKLRHPSRMKPIRDFFIDGPGRVTDARISRIARIDGSYTAEAGSVIVRQERKPATRKGNQKGVSKSGARQTTTASEPEVHSAMPSRYTPISQKGWDPKIPESERIKGPPRNPTPDGRPLPLVGSVSIEHRSYGRSVGVAPVPPGDWGGLRAGCLHDEQAEGERYGREHLGKRGVRSASHPLHGVGRRKKDATPPVRPDPAEEAEMTHLFYLCGSRGRTARPAVQSFGRAA